MLEEKNKYNAIVIGTSAGGLFALTDIMQSLPSGFPVPIIIVQHRSKDNNGLLEEVLQTKCKIKIEQANEKQKLKKGYVYTAPPDYHLMIETDETFSLSVDAKVLYSRPSIDVLFESASVVFREKLVGIILTGANADGAKGTEAVKNMGGLTIAQDPQEALFTVMPLAAIATYKVTHIWSLKDIRNFLLNMADQ